MSDQIFKLQSVKFQRLGLHAATYETRSNYKKQEHAFPGSFGLPVARVVLHNN